MTLADDTAPKQKCAKGAEPRVSDLESGFRVNIARVFEIYCGLTICVEAFDVLGDGLRVGAPGIREGPLF